MLAELKVANLALIKSLTLSFGPGANILTGETGAGKSILAGALSLIRGAKGSADAVRTGAEEAQVEALFQLERPEELRPLFEEQGLTPADELVVQRTVNAAGRTRIRINGALATVAQLAAFGEELLAVSGQHDQQSLVREARQLDFLDAFGRHQELLAAMGAAHQRREAVEKALAALEAELADGLEKRELHEFQLQEIEKVAPRPGEDEELMTRKAAAKSAGKLASAVEEALELVHGQPPLGAEGLARRLDRLARLATRGAALDARFAPVEEAVAAAAQSLAEASDGLDRLARAASANPQELEELDERLNALARLKRKHGPELDGVLARARTLRATLSRLDSGALEAGQLKKNLALARAEAAAAALALRAARAESAVALAASLTATLKVLGFPKLSLRVEVSPSRAPEDAGPKGADQAVFLFCPNPGEGLKPLSKIASGGELSRLMLALKIAQEPRSDQSLLFDEIDSGLSGATAEAVAAKMAELAGRQQIFIITHLPQMACLPGKHFLAAKSPTESGERTETSIAELDSESRTLELARMLGGASPSPEALALSRRLLNLN
ncbi:MAG: DNA repair protein RecN [Deltaproteobacteria bacterium]|jgi:DNA repair protein RecN (Recombination protein N)|nr:DNA repair protein RecN [Deltaproteobacteria bacterium]